MNPLWSASKHSKISYNFRKVFFSTNICEILFLLASVSFYIFNFSSFFCFRVSFLKFSSFSLLLSYKYVFTSPPKRLISSFLSCVPQFVYGLNRSCPVVELCNVSLHLISSHYFRLFWYYFASSASRLKTSECGYWWVIMDSLTSYMVPFNVLFWVIDFEVMFRALFGRACYRETSVGLKVHSVSPIWFWRCFLRTFLARASP